MKLRVALSNGQEHDVIGIDDAEAWVTSFIGRGTSQLGDWLEVVRTRAADASSCAPPMSWPSG